ncbi:hypothetical protein N665_0059s0008 [Sinapis alba]|nr:hypothetical protein N665_0059s0008 [Sinapis alba]
MSMLDSFFNKGFKAAKCKTLLKLTIPRIKLIRNRREAQIKQMRREIAKLLETGQEATARIRVEHIIREEKMMAAQEIIELFSELIAVRLPIIEAQRECPLDLKEAISSVCFAAPRCSDLTELQQVQLLFVSKYGKEFVAAASELKPDSGVNRKLVELLSVRAPSPETKLKLLKEIAQEHQLDWDPASTETDLFKSHEDLLDGPKQFGGGSKVPLKEEQDKGSHLTMLSLSRPEEQSDSDSESEQLDFPEVPNVLLRPNHAATSESAAKPAATYEHTSPDLPFDSGDEKAAAKRDEHTAKASSTVPEGQRSSTESDPVKQNSYSPPSVGVVGSFSSNESDAPRKISDVDLQDVLTAAQAAADSAERAAAAARSAASLAQLRINELTKKTPDQSPVYPTENPFYSSPPQQTMEKPQFDHQNSSVSSYGDHTEFQMEKTSSLFSHQTERLPSMEKPQFDHQNSSASSYGDLTDFQLGDYSSPFNHAQDNHQAGRLPSMEKPRFDHQNSSASSYGDITELQRPETSSFDRLSADQDHQQMRLPSREDDPYYSYPNLFTSQNPDRSPGSRSLSDTSKPAHDS